MWKADEAFEASCVDGLDLLFLRVPVLRVLESRHRRNVARCVLCSRYRLTLPTARPEERVTVRSEV